MYEYRFVKIGTRSSLYKEPKEHFLNLIKEHLMDGWKLVKVFVKKAGNYKQVEYYELFFEKEVV
jgi:hypothetical protein